MVRPTSNVQAGDMTENPTPDGSSEQSSQRHPGTQSDPYTGPDNAGPRVSRDQIRDLGNLRRSTYDRHVGGVAGGIGRHLDIDPVIVRVAFVVLTFFGGAGLIVYLACWLVVPDDTGQRATLNLDARSRTVALVGVGILAALALIGDLLGDQWGPGWFPWPLFILGLIVWVFLTRKDRRAEAAREAAAAQYYASGQPPYGAAPPSYAAPSGAGQAPTGTPSDATSPLPTWPGPTGPYGGAPGTVPMAPMQPPPRNPRKRGPILFWFTVALIALASGVLGIFDLAGANITSSAYPALALGVIATMLTVGAFYGRAGGLIALGLATTLALGASTVADCWDSQKIQETPVSASELESSYYVEAGVIDLDLTQIKDLDQLDGRTLDLRAEVGQIKVLIPVGLNVTTSGQADIGGLNLFDRSSGGLDISLTANNPGDSPRPHLRIDTDVDLGDVTVAAQ